MTQQYDIEALKAKYMPGSTQGGTATPSTGGEYNVEELRKKYLGSATVPVQEKTPTQMKDEESAQKFGSSFASETGEGAIPTALKTIGNIPASAWNFAKGVVSVANPVNTYKNIKETVQAVPDIIEGAKFGYNPTEDLTTGVAKSAYEGLVPEAVRSAISGDVEDTARAITNDPVGQILPIIAGAKGGAKFADTRVSKARMADYVDNIAENTKNRVPIPEPSTKYSDMVDSTLSTAMKPVRGAFSFAGDTISKGTKTAVGQATGLNPDTITEITKNPEIFTKEGMTQIDRPTLGRAIQSELQKRLSDLSETGKSYQPVRESATQVIVEPDFLSTSIRDLGGVQIKNGKITATGVSKIRDSKDIRALQHLYDLWSPSFKKGVLNTDEFLNFRQDLAKLSKFERELGKSTPVESMTALMRGKFNEKYRAQLEGLDKLDEEFSTQTADLKRLGKGLIDKDGNLTDSAINKIANATGKGKDPVLGRLEELMPGVTQRIQILKAVEDIQHASGIKVGTYGRGAIIGSGFVLGGPIQAAISAILTSPELAVPIIRRYGLIKNSAAINTIVTALQSGGNNLKDLVNNKPGAFNPNIRMPETLGAGLSIQNIFAGKADTVVKGGIPITKIANDKLSLAELKQKAYLIDKNGGDIQGLVKAIQDRGTFRIEKSTPVKSKASVPETDLLKEAKKYKSAEEFKNADNKKGAFSAKSGDGIKKEASKYQGAKYGTVSIRDMYPDLADAMFRMPDDTTVYRGTGKGIGNSTLVNGEYWADSKKFAEAFGNVTESKIPKNAAVFDLDIIKNDPKQTLIPKKLLVDQQGLTDFLVDKGIQYTKNTNTRGVEFVKLNKLETELRRKASSMSEEQFKKFVMSNYEKYRSELARISKDYTSSDNSRLRSPITDIWEKANKSKQ